MERLRYQPQRRALVAREWRNMGLESFTLFQPNVDMEAWATTVPYVRSGTGHTAVPTTVGVGVSQNGGNNIWQNPGVPGKVIGTGNQFSFMLSFQLNSTGQTSRYMLMEGMASNQSALIYGYVANTFEFFAQGFTGTDPRTGTGIVVNDTKPHTLVYTYDGATFRGFLDGQEKFAITRTFSLNPTNAGSYIGGANATTSVTNATFYAHARFSQAIPREQAIQLSANPWTALMVADDVIDAEADFPVPAGQPWEVEMAWVQARTQPQERFVINQANPITQGLTLAFVNGTSASGFTGSLQANSAYVNGTQIGVPFGTAMQLKSSSSRGYLVGPHGLVTTNYSLFAVATAGSAALSATYNAIDLDNGGPRYFQFRIANGKVDFIPFDTAPTPATTGVCTSPVAMTATELAKGFTMGATASSTRTACFQNGVLAATATPVNLTAPKQDVSLTVGARAAGSSGWWLTGGIGLVVGWNRTLTDAEMASLAANPWQLFLVPMEEIWLGSMSAGGITITSASGSSVGSSSLSALASAIANTYGTSTGVSTVSSSTISLFYAGGNTSGTSTNAANGVSVYLTSGSSTSTATVSGNAYSIWNVQANAVGSAGNSAGGVALVPVAGGTAGTSSVNGTGSALTPAAGSASGTAIGTSDAAAIASAFYNAIANAVGTATASGGSASTSSATANASGSAAGSASGSARANASGSSAGTSVTAAGGVILACASGAATGLANVNGLSVAIYGAQGMSVSAAQVQALVISIASAFGDADGKATVSGITEGGLHYTAVGDKFHMTVTLSTYKIDSVSGKYNISFKE